MATYYIDLVNGNDANSGADWANAKKTIAAIGAATLNPGDEVRIAKTMDETSLSQNATFTNGSITVTLTSAVTKDVTEGLNGTWTVSANVTASNSTNRKHGASCESLAIAAGFTTGKVAYASIYGGGTQNFSAYQKMSLWFSANATVAASTFRVCLCSDAIGDVIVDSFYIPAIATGLANVLVPLVIDKGSACGASIQSVAIYADVDPGTVTIRVNNCFTTNTLNLTSIIGTTGKVWWSVRSILGTTVLIDQANTNDNSTGRGWYGVNTTETIYYRDPFQGTSGSNIFTTQDAGTVTGGYINYIGGWDTGSNTRTGMTIIDNYSPTYSLSGIIINGSYVKVSYCGIVRSSLGVTVNGSYIFCEFNNGFIGTCTSGTSFGTSYYPKMDNVVSTLSFSQGFNTSNTGRGATYSNLKSYSGQTAGMNMFGGTQLFTCDFQNNAGADIYLYDGYDWGTFSVLGRHIKMGSTTEVSMQAAYPNVFWSWHHDDVTDNNWGFTYQGTINWQTAIFQGSDPGSWKVAISGSSRNSNMPIRMKLAEIAVSASSLVTFTCWVKKDHATNVAGKIYVLGSEYSIAGVVAASATKANDTNWEQLTLTFTPSEAGVVDIWCDSWYVAGNSNVYYGSITVTQ